MSLKKSLKKVKKNIVFNKFLLYNLEQKHQNNQLTVLQIY